MGMVFGTSAMSQWTQAKAAREAQEYAQNSCRFVGRPSPFGHSASWAREDCSGCGAPKRVNCACEHCGG